ncbi:FxsA family protein [Actinomadura bangladeshensis]|uniref:FxsA family protein n=1 Tax=Actinomadura bangladeshensis TaxID=453573 RepID=A0A4R4NCD4_9ACTN|nr:FxsA family protein [Actinomadura bangladeshensis]TDC06625.1 FxsA family protein [Actinomadura bangladeshensis]
MLPLLILLAFLLVPALEIFVLILVGGAIGAWPVIGLLAAETVLGAWLVRREGRRAFGALHDTVRTGVLQDRELGDAALVMAGGMLLLFPGFVTDAVGLVFVLPFTRPLVRRALSAFAARRLRAAEERAATVFPPGFPPGPGAGFDPFGRNSGPERVETPPGPVVRGEVIREDDDTASRA